MTTYSLSDARKKFSKLVHSVQTQGTQFGITLNGKTAATLISQEDYENLLETLEILQDQEILSDIVTSEKEYEKGEVVSLSEL